MRLFGDNSKYGTEEVELAGGKRTVGVCVEEGQAFPCGVAGLIPVTSKRKKGGTKTVYAFPTAEGDSGELEQTDELAVITDGVDLINRLLSQAAELAKIELGQIAGVSMGITEDNYGFTRVEIVPIDAHNKPSETPVHLHIETSEVPAEPGTLSCVIELDGEGAPARVLICEYNDRGATLRINVNVNEKTGKLSVQKVEDIRGGDARLLYKRGWTPQGVQYVEARREGREGGERGGKFVRQTGRAPKRESRDDFGGGRDGRFERGGRRNRFDDERDGRRDDRRGERRDDRRAGGRPAKRDEVPGMRRIDGSVAKRGGTHPTRDSDFDDRDYRSGGRDGRDGRNGRDDRRWDDRGGRDYEGDRRYDDRHGGRGGHDDRGGREGRDGRGQRQWDDRGGRKYDDRRSGASGEHRSNGGSRSGSGRSDGNRGASRGGRPGRSGDNGGSRRY